MTLDHAGLRDALAHFRKYGYAVVRGVFSRAETLNLAAAFDRHWAEGMAHRSSFRHGNLLYRLGIDPTLGKVVRLVQWPSYGDAALERIRRDSRIFEILEPLLGRDIKQIINQLHWKPPGAASSDFAFHQDARFRRPPDAYRNLATSYVQTGIAIDRHDAANGAMRVVPGSHRLGALTIPAPERILGGSPEAAALESAGLDPRTLADIELEPGDVALWNAFLVHGSGANATPGDRRFYLNGYVRAEDCDRGEWAFRDGKPVALGAPTLVHYDDLAARPDPHYLED
jgi:ectoine hydroxylase-related dioxygenase (phytanoyl-CoA dioxygenase family)